MTKLFTQDNKLLSFCNRVFDSMNDEFMLEQVIWVVANVAGDCFLLRDMMLKNTTAVKAIEKYLYEKA